MVRRLSTAAHTSRPWRIHEIAPDFEVEDAWAFHTPGAGPDDFPAMLAALQADLRHTEGPSLTQFLFAARSKLGGLLGWDDPGTGLGGRVRPLCDRLPDGLRGPRTGKPMPGTPFTTVYELHDERAEELANKTVHGIVHFGWVPAGDGDHELRMTVLVKPNGRLGRLYLTAIAPFRYLIVYPALTRRWEHAWRDRDRIGRYT
ncbi:DUF2867 domain-containing protein [Amycolatopsis sp. NBC_00345]|uniref:DUF2867 domain-containing protein n=1 Tax=Amycolatopsis sp. NBC_00345 TaxID=2975955 RepID=UPI002E2745C2